MLMVTLSPETQQLVADAVSTHGYASADDLVREAVRALVMPVDEPTNGELDAALDAADRGDTVAWDDVKAELRARLNIAD